MERQILFNGLPICLIKLSWLNYKEIMDFHYLIDAFMTFTINSQEPNYQLNRAVSAVSMPFSSLIVIS